MSTVATRSRKAPQRSTRPAPKTWTPAALGLAAEPVTAAHDDPIAHHVRAALDKRLRALVAHDPGTRVGEDVEELHQMRVAVRRMRAMLKAARPMLDRRWADGLREELGWLGRALGPVRDLDVLLERLHEEAAGFPDAERVAADQLVAGLVEERKAARTEMLSALNDSRYKKLLRALAKAVAAPLPGSASTVDNEADGAGAGLLPLVRKQFEKLAKAVHQAGEQPPDDELHELRIYGKRLRYTAELAEPVAGKTVRELLKATMALQDVLGDHQDACVAQDRVRELLNAQGDVVDFDLVFVAGRLVEREQARRADCRARWWACWLELEYRATKL